MSNNSSQKFIARNRAPRVQIEYDVEIYGSEKKIELPFVMGVLADVSGKPVEPLAAVAARMDNQFIVAHEQKFVRTQSHDCPVDWRTCTMLAKQCQKSEPLRRILVRLLMHGVSAGGVDEDRIIGKPPIALERAAPVLHGNALLLCVGLPLELLRKWDSEHANDRADKQDGSVRQ